MGERRDTDAGAGAGTREGTTKMQVQHERGLHAGITAAADTGQSRNTGAGAATCKEPALHDWNHEVRLEAATQPIAGRRRTEKRGQTDSKVDGWDWGG